MNQEEINNILLENKSLKEENKKLRELLKKQKNRTELIERKIDEDRLENEYTVNMINDIKEDNEIFESETITQISSKKTLEKSNNIKKDSENNMSIISFLARSEKRVQILKSLSEGNKIPSIIGKDIGDSSHHVSKYLASLKENGLVVCLNENDKRFRFYEITADGMHYLNIIENKKY